MSDTSMLALVSKLSADLEAEGIVHALTGSIASGLHGEPVTSLDVDVVVSMSVPEAVRMAKKWESDLCADEESFRQAAQTRSIASMLHFPTGLKVDISVLPDTPYYREVMRRRVRFSTPDRQASFWVVTPEDIILMKLWWRRDSRSEKQWANALSVARLRGHLLDWKYLRYWAEELEILTDLDQLMAEAGI